MNELAGHKAALRERMRRILREHNPATNAEEARRVWDQLAPRLQHRVHVALFAARAGELPLDLILPESAWELPRRWAFPRIADPTTLTFHWCPRPPRSPGPLGIRQPLPDTPEAAPGALHAVLVPGCAFDSEGGRLGWGRGYYDRFLATLGPDVLRIGVALPCQLLPRVPTGDHDIRMHAVVTPHRWVDISARRMPQAELPLERT